MSERCIWFAVFKNAEEIASLFFRELNLDLGVVPEFEAKKMI